METSLTIPTKWPLARRAKSRCISARGEAVKLIGCSFGRCTNLWSVPGCACARRHCVCARACVLTPVHCERFGDLARQVQESRCASAGTGRGEAARSSQSSEKNPKDGKVEGSYQENEVGGHHSHVSGRVPLRMPNVKDHEELKRSTVVVVEVVEVMVVTVVCGCCVSSGQVASSA